MKGYEIAVKEGGAYAIMTTYGAVNGLWTAGNYDLLITILRQEWGYEGLVMTDWWAKINDEGQAPTAKNVAAMVRSRNDVYMVVQDSENNSGQDNLAESLADGTLNRSDLAECAMNILRVLMRSAVMDRSLGRISQEELEASKTMEDEDTVNFDLDWYSLETKLVLDGKGIDTGKGKSFLCGLTASGRHPYVIRLRVKVEASEPCPGAHIHICKRVAAGDDHLKQYRWGLCGGRADQRSDYQFPQLFEAVFRGGRSPD